MHINHMHILSLAIGVAIGYFVLPTVVASIRGNG